MYSTNFYSKNGYIILKNVFTESEIGQFREEVFQYMETNNNKLIKNSKGITIPNFIDSNDFKKLSEIRYNNDLHKALSGIFKGNDYRFCHHNDIGINRIVGWHKDKLNGEYSKFETVDIWSSHKDEKHEIVKVLIYLQDHSNDNFGLKLIPGSHMEKDIKIKNIKQLKPAFGDIIIFDQRITHRGMESQPKDTRILVTFGFGKNNIFTDNFEKGTIKRQNDQNNI